MPQQRKLDEEDSLRRYAQLVRRIIRPYYLQGGDYDDLYQEGMVGLLRAVRRYDPERGAGFEAFASVCIRRQVIDALRREASLSERDKKLLELTLWEGDKIFLRLLDEDIPFFSLKLVYEGDKLTQAVLNGMKLDT